MRAPQWTLRLLLITAGIFFLASQASLSAGGPVAPHRVLQSPPGGMQPRLTPIPQGAIPPGAPVVPRSTEPPVVGAVPNPIGNAAVPVGPVALPATPVVSLRMRVASTSAQGQDLVYRITVRNRSRADAHHVEVRNPIPANADFVRADPNPSEKQGGLVWDLGTLKACESKTIEMVLRPTGTGDVTSCARVHFAHGQCCTTRIVPPGSAPTRPGPPPVTPPETAKARLRLEKIGPKQAILHNQVKYRLVVTNIGGAVAEDVQLTDLLPEKMTVLDKEPQPDQKSLLVWNLGALRAGEKRTFEYNAVTRSSGTFTNRAVVTASGGIREEATSTLNVGEPRLKVSINGPQRRYVNRPAVYFLTIANEGEVTANNVTLSYEIPNGTNVDTISNSGLVQNGKVIWMMGLMAPRSRRTVQLRLLAKTAGEIEHKAIASADEQKESTAVLRTVLKGFAGLSMTIDDTDPLELKQEGRYTIVVKNTGNADAHNVRIQAIVPPQLRLTDHRGPSKGSVAKDVLRYDPITLQPGREVKYEVFVSAIKPGDARFRVKLEADELSSGPVQEEESTNVFTSLR